MSAARQADPGGLPAGLASPARRALTAAGITSLDQLAMVSEAELLKLHGMGPRAVEIIRQELIRHGLKFADPVESRPVSERTNEKIEKRGKNE